MRISGAPRRASAAFAAILALFALSGCAPQLDPVDLPPTFTYEESASPAATEPELFWTADRTGVVVSFESTLVAGCSAVQSATIEQVDEHNLTVEVVSTASRTGFCLGTAEPLRVTANFPDGETPETPAFVNLGFPDSGQHFELTLSGGVTAEPSSTPADLPPSFTFGEDPYPPEVGPEVLWAADQTGVVVKFASHQLAPCSVEHSSTIEQVDDRNFTVVIRSTGEAGGADCPLDDPLNYETINFPAGEAPGAPVFIDLSFPDTNTGYELTLS